MHDSRAVQDNQFRSHIRVHISVKQDNQFIIQAVVHQAYLVVDSVVSQWEL